MLRPMGYGFGYGIRIEFCRYFVSVMGLVTMPVSVCSW
jgi:hypothetical protein